MRSCRIFATFAVFVMVASCGWLLAEEEKKPEKGAEKGAEKKPEKVEPKVVAGKPIENSIGMKLAPVEPGTFLMGSTNEFGRLAHEHQHEVTLSAKYYIGVYEVTQAQFDKVIDKNPSYFTKSGKGKDRVGDAETANFPVDSVTWEQARDFCRRLSSMPAEKKANRFYRLPTEAEWEFACRAGTKTVFHLGESLASAQANFDGNHPYLTREDVIKGESIAKLAGPFLKRPTTVGSYEANALGLYDMHGNVREWVADWYSPVYFKNSPKNDPKGPEKGTKKVARGGDWYYFAAGCRSASRYDHEPDEPRNYHGFRVVCEIGKKARF